MDDAASSIGEQNRNTALVAVEDWHLWCRLCAKADMQNINIFFKDEHLPWSFGNKERKLALAIGEYFRVHITQNEELPKMLCTDCFSLLTSLVNFHERVIKVQQMYAELENLHTSNGTHFGDVRLKYGVIEEERQQFFMHHAMPEMHLFEAKPKVNEYEQHIFAEEATDVVTANASCMTMKIKKEHLNDIAQAEEDAFEFEKEDEEGEDPFGSENEKYDKTFHLTDDDADGNSNSSGEIEIGIKELSRRQKTKTNLKSSIASGEDSKEYKYSCNNCSQRFQRISNYRVHMKKKHGIVGVLPPFTCSQCSRSFKFGYELKSHMKKHHSRTFICEECGDIVRTNAALREHMLTHTGQASVECKVCGKCFKHKTRLKKHMETHDPNKHICGECGFELNSRATLKRHLLVHSNEMLHKCDYCGRAFKRSKTLKNHLILHTGLKPYACDFCDRTFANGSNCRTHKRKAHPVELAALEASGEKTFTKNIPNLAVLKSVTRVAENLTPVVSKQSGNFAFGKKSKLQSGDINTASRKHTEIQTQNLSSSGSNANAESIPVVTVPTNNEKSIEDASDVRNVATNDNKYSNLLKQAQQEFCSQPRPVNEFYDFGQ